MKHLKYFEDNKQFKIGDYVKCVDSSCSNFLIYNNIYIVINNEFSGSLKPHIIVEENPNGAYPNIKFKLATPKEIEQYELEKSTNKYNL